MHLGVDLGFSCLGLTQLLGFVDLYCAKFGEFSAIIPVFPAPRTPPLRSQQEWRTFLEPTGPEAQSFPVCPLSSGLGDSLGLSVSSRAVLLSPPKGPSGEL